MNTSERPAGDSGEVVLAGPSGERAGVADLSATAGELVEQVRAEGGLGCSDHPFWTMRTLVT